MLNYRGDSSRRGGNKWRSGGSASRSPVERACNAVDLLRAGCLVAGLHRLARGYGTNLWTTCLPYARQLALRVQCMHRDIRCVGRRIDFDRALTMCYSAKKSCSDNFRPDGRVDQAHHPPANQQLRPCCTASPLVDCRTSGVCSYIVCQ